MVGLWVAAPVHLQRLLDRLWVAARVHEGQSLVAAHNTLPFGTVRKWKMPTCRRGTPGRSCVRRRDTSRLIGDQADTKLLHGAARMRRKHPRVVQLRGMECFSINHRKQRRSRTADTEEGTVHGDADIRDVTARRRNDGTKRRKGKTFAGAHMC